MIVTIVIRCDSCLAVTHAHPFDTELYQRMDVDMRKLLSEHARVCKGRGADGKPKVEDSALMVRVHECPKCHAIAPLPDDGPSLLLECPDCSYEGPQEAFETVKPISQPLPINGHLPVPDGLFSVPAKSNRQRKGSRGTHVAS